MALPTPLKSPQRRIADAIERGPDGRKRATQAALDAARRAASLLEPAELAALRSELDRATAAPPTDEDTAAAEAAKLAGVTEQP